VDAFIGRQREIEELKLLLGSRQLLILTGPGGVGKTRLAVELGSVLRHNFPQGVEFVDFSPVREPDQWIPILASVIRAPGSAEPHIDDVINHLQARKLLLILDNFEHLSENSAHIGMLVAKCPNVSVIVTSRIRLQIRGEQEYPVPPLGLPERLARSKGTPDNDLPQAPAISLFEYRARAAKPTFALGPHNSAVVAELCCKLDGLPLAIELAAARIGAFTPHQLLNMLHESLDVLKQPQRDVPLRHRSLRDTIQLSYDLLNPDAQHMFRCLSVFSGGWSLDAAAAIATSQSQSTSTFAEILTNLIDHSLVFSRATREGSASRFGMLESVREFASEKLDEHGDRTAVRRAHGAYFCAIAEKAKYGLGGPDQKSWLDQLTTEHGNLQAALQNAIALSDVDTALRMCSSLWRYWAWHGHLSEGIAWIKRALEIPAPVDLDVRGDALHTLGNLALDMHDYDLANRCFLDALEIWQARSDLDGVAVELTGLGLVARNGARYEQAEQYFQQALAIWTDRGDRFKIAVAMHNLGDLTTQTGDYLRSREWHRKALTIRSQIEDMNGIAYSLLGLSATDLYLGDTENAEARFSETFVRFQDSEDVEGQAYALYGLGRCAQHRGDPELALTRFREALEMHHTLADRQGVAECLEGLAFVANAKGENDIAAEFLGAATVLLTATKGVMTEADHSERQRTEDAVEMALGSARFQRLLDAGSALSLEEIVAKAHVIA
jgi:predicted ATPase